MRRTRTLLVAVTLTVVAGAVGCAHENDRDDERRSQQAAAAQPTGVSLSFIQLRADEGSSRAQLRVVNDSDQTLDVTGVGLDWPGYGTFDTDYETAVAAGRVLDLRFELPPPDCAASEADLAEPVVGRLGLSGDLLVTDELDESGTGYVARIRQRTCDEERVAQAVQLRYGPGWRVEGTGRRAEVVGTVTLVRRAETGPVTVTGIQGSVLLRPLLDRPLALRAGEASATVGVRVVLPRCDEHALTESSQTFHFKPTFRFGSGADAETVTVLRIPDAGSRQAGQRLITAACVVDGSAS